MLRPLYRRESALRTHSLTDWLDRTANVEGLEKRTISRICRESNHNSSVVHSMAQSLYRLRQPSPLQCTPHFLQPTALSAISSSVALTIQSLLVTWCTTSLTFNNCKLCPHCIYVFCIYLRTNGDLYHLYHKVIGFYNRYEKCLQRGTDWVFK